MKRKYNLRNLKAKKSYSNFELASTLVVHIQTVRGWRKNGLKPIDETVHHPLYLGSTVQTFLKEKLKKKKVKLKPNEFYCFGCRDKTTSIKTTLTLQNKLIGKDVQSIRREGICIKCGQRVNRFSSNKTNDLDTTKVINKGSSTSL